MQTTTGFPYFEVQFNKEGGIHDDTEVKLLLDFMNEGTVTDLFVISHGWNNNLEDARKLYKAFFGQVRAEIDSSRLPKLQQRNFAVLGILWPSMKFEDAALIASGAASIGATQPGDELRQQLDLFKGAFDNPEADILLDRAAALSIRVETDQPAAIEFVDIIRSLPTKKEIHPDDRSDEFFALTGNQLIDILSRPDIPVPVQPGQGGAADFDASVTIPDTGGAAGFDFFGGVKSALRKVLNFTTYYQMKERAGTVGRNGAYTVLSRLRERHQDLKVHLIGHSFGGRLVTALADGPEGMKPIIPATLTLLQAAFSHNGFAQKFDETRDGFFRKVVTEKKVSGPILITHSIKDVAVGMAYPIASKLSGSDAATFGDRNDRFGGIGRNGARFTPEAIDTVPLGPVTTTYTFELGKLYNLNADTIILEHSDIIKGEIAHALLSAVAST